MKVILFTIAILCAYAAGVVHMPGVSHSFAKGCPPLCSVPL